ncbi:helix-turn-helix domain-containing protein [Nocardia wallacei]|uniref:helix-turn-helix domain-containing protein n=1 Tax=Nocardia wallacei TaxID=480035 RepID=UPI002457C84C|nr:helix-turn-helix transcriptional regulator [Nocardia wallacei]
MEQRGDINREIGRAIADARKAVDPRYTGPEMARDLGMSYRHFKRLEAGEMRCPPDLLERVAEVLGTEGKLLYALAADRLKGLVRRDTTTDDVREILGL